MVLHTSTSMIILQNEIPVGHHLLHPRREHQAPVRVLAEALPLRLGGKNGGALRPQRIRRSLAWPPNGIHTITHLKSFQQLVPMRERGKVLRERYRVPTELAQSSPRNSHELHLHVIQGDQHRLSRSGGIEKLS